MASSDNAALSNQLWVSQDFPKTGNKEFDNALILFLKRTADTMNTKEGALYLLQEVATFQQYFTIDNPQTNRNSYRTTFDLVDLNGGPIPNGTTNINITSSTNPPLIDSPLYPVHGFGGAVIAGPIFVFVNDPQLYVRFNNTVPGAQVVTVVNSTGTNVTSLIWTMEYLKN